MLRPGPARRWCARVTLAAFFLQALWGGLAPPRAQARVNPLNYLVRALSRPNMLFVLDTSNSHNSVPGSPFGPSSDVGMDCDNGQDCRAGIAGTCGKTKDQFGNPLACTRDLDCQVGYCQNSGAPCFQSTECPGSNGYCSADPTISCSRDADCPQPSGTCSATGVVCDSTHPCASVSVCQYGGRSCTTDADCPLRSPGACVVGGAACTADTGCPLATTGACAVGGAACSSTQPCPVAGTCKWGGTACNLDSDCPSSSTVTGTCKYGPTPAGGCTSNDPCLAQTSGTCSLTNTSCSTNADCPVSCASNTDCPVGVCTYLPGKTCASWADCATSFCTDASGSPGASRVQCKSSAQCPAAYPNCTAFGTPCSGYDSNGNPIGNSCSAGYCTDVNTNGCAILANYCDLPTGTCAQSGATCSLASPCPSHCSNSSTSVCTVNSDCNRCSNGSTTKCATNSDCGRCSNNSATICTSSNYQTTCGGACSNGAGACTTAANCGAGKCSNNATLSCTVSSDCGGTCSNNAGVACTSSNYKTQCGGACSNNASIACTPTNYQTTCGGTCQGTGAPCTSNSNCGACANSPTTNCTQPSNCPGTCANNGSVCHADLDCGGACNPGSQACKTSADCGGTCTNTNAVCNKNPDCSNTCSNMVTVACTADSTCHVCSNNTAKLCTVNSNCYVCSNSTSTSCTTNANCTSCSNNSAKICTKDSDCGGGQAKCTNTSGTCSTGATCSGSATCSTSNTCVSNKTCQAISTCNFPTCNTPVTCNLIYTCNYYACNYAACTLPTCNFYSCSFGTCQTSGTCNANSCGNLALNTCSRGNTCNYPYTTCDKSNPCVPGTNICTGGGASTCVGQTGSGDTCILPNNPNNDVCVASGGGTTSSGLLMCQVSLTSCKKDSDCKSGPLDTCGPSTAREVMEKRVIKAVIWENYNLFNFGLMTFWQGNSTYPNTTSPQGYFPYYSADDAALTPVTMTTFHPVEELRARGCYDDATGPAPTCQMEGTLTTLKGTGGCHYRVNDGGTFVYSDRNWCGFNCDVPTLGPGQYLGSYYQFPTSIKVCRATGVPCNSNADCAKSDQCGDGVDPTVMVTYPYGGKLMSRAGTNWGYYNPTPDTYKGQPPLIATPTCKNGCSATCGGRWDEELAPFMDTGDTEQAARDMALAIDARMEKAKLGGLISWGTTPTGCTLYNDVASDERHSAYHYIQKVKAGDTAPCRTNNVLLLTDGSGNGPGDVNTSGLVVCRDANCQADDPVAAGCKCLGVTAAYRMRKDLGVKTYVVGFGVDATNGNALRINDNVAKAGGTTASYTANDEGQLFTQIQNVLYDALRGSYQTAPAASSSASSVSTGTTTILAGKYLLDARLDFPEWKGHLIAYNVSGATPVLSWDSGTRMDAGTWWTRRMYTWSPTQGMVKFVVDQTSLGHPIVNAAQLQALGLGATPAEADMIGRWMLGDPTMKNPAVLGAMINSTPIDVGQPGDSPMPGGHAFFLAHTTRPHLTYVGSDDGMLHAFFTEAVGGFSGGDEAFSFIPADLLPMVTELYAQGGQKADPRKHLFGMANSPKVKNICVSGCTDGTTAVWKTVLMMPEGYGGGNAMAVDITSPVTPSGVMNDPPVAVLWHTAYPGYPSGPGPFAKYLGDTISVPGFFFKKTETLDDYRLIFASGYPVTAGTNQGTYVVTTKVATGDIPESPIQVRKVGACTDTTPGQDFTVLADVATARDYFKSSNGIDEMQKLLAAYVGDTWGNLWRYVPSNATQGSTLSLVASLGCNNPLHYAPTVVQLDRDQPLNHTHEIYIVQATNSPLDPVTAGFSPSKLVIMKDLADWSGDVTSDPTFANTGRIELQVGTSNQICAVTNLTGATCLTPMPLTARPNATPSAVLEQDGTGFYLFTPWFVPSTTCDKGTTYLTLHQIQASGVTRLVQAMEIGSEPISGVVFNGGNIYVVGSGSVTLLTPDFATGFTQGVTAPTPPTNPDAFRLLSWRELE